MRQSTLDTLISRFDPEAASGMDEVFQFHFDDADSHYLVIQNGELSVAQGEHDDLSLIHI